MSFLNSLYTKIITALFYEDVTPIHTDKPLNVKELPNGLYLLVDTPEYAYNLKEGTMTYGWVFMRNGKIWETHRQMGKDEIQQLKDHPPTIVK